MLNVYGASKMLLTKNYFPQKNRDVLDPVCRHKRTDYGLPEDKFIFACFNQLYKMDPEIFNTWYSQDGP